jgi:hypothetical protein
MTEMRKETDSLGVVEVPATNSGALKPSAHPSISVSEKI